MRDDYSNVDSTIEKLSGALAEHLQRVWSPHFETLPPITLGGPTGTYQLFSPFDSPCEYCVIAAAFTGVGTAALSSVGGVPVPGTNTSIQNAPTQQVFTGLANTMTPLVESYHMLNPGDILTLVTNVTSGACWLTLKFRRRQNQAGVFQS